jgi:diguanylate cyclase (GGDEF)-like protein
LVAGTLQSAARTTDVGGDPGRKSHDVRLPLDVRAVRLQQDGQRDHDRPPEAADTPPAPRAVGERSRRPWYGLEDRHVGLLVGRLVAVASVASAAWLAPGSLFERDALWLTLLCAAAAGLHLALWLIPSRWPRWLRLAVDLSLPVDVGWAASVALATGGSGSPLLWLLLLAALGATLGYSTRTGIKSAVLVTIAYLALVWNDAARVGATGSAGRLIVFWSLVAAAAAGAAAGERELRRRADRLSLLHETARRMLTAEGEPAMTEAARAAASEILPAWEAGVRLGDGPAEVRLSREGDLALISVPVVGGGGAPIGAIECRRLASGRRSPTLRGRELVALETIAATLGSALWRAELVGEIERASVTDALTGLANRRGFDAELSRELARSGRTGAPVALCLIDVDHFKAYNDAHGHQAGDRALAAVGAALAEVARRTDRAARYGGEELALLLPETTLEEAVLVGERVRAAVERTGLEHGAVTVSVGVAAAEGARTPEELVAVADSALYASKRSGRNHVHAGGTIPAR